MTQDQRNGGHDPLNPTAIKLSLEGIIQELEAKKKDLQLVQRMVEGDSNAPSDVLEKLRKASLDLEQLINRMGGES